MDNTHFKHRYLHAVIIKRTSYNMVYHVCLHICSCTWHKFSYQCTAGTKHHIGFTDIRTFEAFATTEVVMPI